MVDANADSGKVDGGGHDTIDPNPNIRALFVPSAPERVAVADVRLLHLFLLRYRRRSLSLSLSAVLSMVLFSRLSMRSLSATNRTAAIARHMASSSGTPAPEEPTVLYEENGAMRRYILNRPRKMNSLDTAMLDSLAARLEPWDKAELAGIIVGSSDGRAFCAGGDVAGVVKNAESDDTRPKAIEFFRREFGLNHTLAALSKPYVAVMNGITFGGGMGLVFPAPFRVATEKTSVAMPETKIGYCPDVGASYYLSRLDGQIGTYLGLTSAVLPGRAAFEHGLATHYISSARVPILYERLAALENPTLRQIDDAIEELHWEREPSDPVSSLTGAVRNALDSAFSHNTVEEIIAALKKYAEGSTDSDVVQWAKDTLAVLNERSPTGLKVALLAIRKGKDLSLLDALKMELGFATAFCSGATPDFKAGVTHVLIDKKKTGYPSWSPATLEEVSVTALESTFFKQDNAAEGLILPDSFNVTDDPPPHPMRFALPTEEEIGQIVMGRHQASGSSALTLSELINKLEDLKRGKYGVADKVKEVVSRRCGHNKREGEYLEWKH
ncbi:3-hydroxyisobutyryl-coenzyme A hydrolase [Artomyces pyxidatus]|uniref:3-hydroxyisobutyryl-coenzyme A hydrolase n=1 Tax=Artomyces pyxidatus TaxID=48021 RepID=A0ACB8T8E6_9AGAM|nr:3-hydroxyisobutyryl-coenzyme A hydrolase [Artomyces pyxidatus]